MAGGFRIGEGSPHALGARLTEDGVNVAVWSAHAAAIEVCLFAPDGVTETARIPLPGRTGSVFHGEIAGVGAGALYGLRAHGPFAPTAGHRFNPNKLLIDPYALALDRPLALDPAMFGDGADGFEPSDSGAGAAKAVVTATPAARVRPRLATPWGRTVLYELHVRGFTRAMPGVPEAVRGTFAGLAHPAAIAHLQRLGVTAVELLPAAAWIDERRLPPLGLSNYWGYNPIAFMAPDPRLAPGGWDEVRAAVEALSAAGVETILDVVFNHTGESDEDGPTLSLRGLDNASYYRLQAHDPSRYVNDAGTGNVLALERPGALRLVMDSLRAWASFGGVDGFRFDLATTLGRRADGFDPAAPLLSAIEQDPELRGLKLIAEPWDCGPGGYQLGRFPPAWGEWNDRFRDAARGFWRGDGVALGELATRLAGSQDVFGGRAPSRSVNFVVAHDGFTLADLVAYEAKRNQANGEANRDGGDDNRSWNNGVEGETDDPAILGARLRDQRALLATLLLARGTPMLAMGAELGQSQGGNNNAYAQDNATSWLDWERADQGLIAFTARLVEIRRTHPALRADRFLTGAPQGGRPYPDVAWRRADGEALSGGDWQDGETLVMLLAEADGDGLDRVVAAVHRGRSAVEITLPEPRDGFAWSLLADSADEARRGAVEGPSLLAAGRSTTVLAEVATPGRRASGTDPAVLGALALAAGIEPDWWSLDGERRAVGPDTQRALLAAMVLPAATTTQALASLQRLVERRDHRPLPAALVARVGDPIRVPLRFAADAPPPRTWLTIETEDGTETRMRVGADLFAEVAHVAADGSTGRALAATAPALAPGRYRVRREDRPETTCWLTVAPRRCFAPPALAGGRRRLGVSAQIYALRRDGDQGIGDFTTLGALGAAAAQAGCATLGINPLHALFPQQRDRASPYYPSDRRFLDPIYLDLGAAPLTGPVPAGAAALRDRPEIDYPAVWSLKAEALERAFAEAEDPGFAAFVAAGGQALRRFAVFQAAAEAFPRRPWTQWPAELRDPDGAGVEAFAQAHGERVRFHLHLQWLCEQQLAGAARRARGLALGFCRDLAVGAAPDGAETWAFAGQLAVGASIGAPPDAFAAQGQVWGLPPFDPHRIQADGYGAHGALFAANMRHAGALRIDHVIGLARQFWVPHGAQGVDGANVRFPLDDLLGVLALESARAECLVIGEDLGTVPPGLREALAGSGVLGYRVLPFERDGARFKPQADYPPLSWACVATHDLAPIAGWWDGVDIRERGALGLATEADTAAALDGREDEKRSLIQALSGAGLLDAPSAAPGPLTPALAAAVHAFIAGTPSLLAIAQVEDLAGERAAINLPGTDRERPNWRKRIAAPLESLFAGDLAEAILAAMRRARPDMDTAPPPLPSDRPAQA